MSSCFGFRKRSDEDEREPLLPRYDDDTALQRRLHAKLHSYQMVKALTEGYMPSTEQTIILLRTVLASDLLNQSNTDLTESGRRLTKFVHQWLVEFMDLLEHKNSKDQIQDTIWFLSKSKVDVDTDDLAKRLRKTRAKADTAAAYESLRTVGSLLLTNSDFRVFLSDLNVVGREVFRDSAFTLSNVAEEAAKQIEPSEADKKALTEPGADDSKQAPSKEDLGKEVAEVSKIVANGTSEVAKTAADSAHDKLAGDEGRTLIHRLKQAIVNLRERKDYSESVSVISLLIKRYAMVYSRAAGEITEVAQRDVKENEALDRAVHNLWIFITSFGEKKEWDECERLFKKLMVHKESDPQFEDLMEDAGDSLEKLLTDPDFIDNAQEKFTELREKNEKSGNSSNLSKDIQALLNQVEKTWVSVVHDDDIQKLTKTTLRIFSILSPENRAANPELFQDSVNVFVPLLISAIQHIPIPRLEISTPEVDLLLENLIIEPGKTVNHTSFLPYKLKVENYNDVTIRKAKFRTVSSMKNLVTIKIDGISAKAEELGFWLRAHKGILRLADEGIASFALDERGVDVHIDVEIGREKLEQILTLRDVRVKIHKLNYQTRKSKFSILGWLFKPMLRPIIKKVLERQMAKGLAEFFHFANRELVFARERLRATRIADPNDLMTFIKAVAARLKPEDDPDHYTRVGFKEPGKGVFKGVYAPGSIVKVWNEQAVQARERIEDFEVDGWRNEIFKTHVTTMS